MGDNSTAPTASPVRPGATGAGALCAVAAAGAMALYARLQLPLALAGHGESALLGGVLVGVAGLGSLLCAYLALVWSMACAVVLMGPASRTGKALLGTLRVLAPQVARRITLTAAVATTATGLVLVPATAAEQAEDPSPPGQIAVAATLSSTTVQPSDGAHSPPPVAGPTSDQPETGPEEPGLEQVEATEPAAGTGSNQDSAPRPGLGWTDSPQPEPDLGSAPHEGSESEQPSPPEAEQPAPAEADEREPAPDPAPQPGPRTPGAEVPSEAAPAPGSEAAPDVAPQSSPQFPLTVEVQPGDTLWGITDDLMGPGDDAPEEVSDLWPILHDANSDVIGADPDHLEPGQVLVVPADLSPQEQS